MAPRLPATNPGCVALRLFAELVVSGPCFTLVNIYGVGDPVKRLIMLTDFHIHLVVSI